MRLRRAVLRALREGGIPRGVTTFRLADDPELAFVAADSLVLAQLYWYGEQGWEPELLPWWRRYCRRAESVLELGANVGYFTVQAARTAPGHHHVSVEPPPFSLEICRANLALNQVDDPICGKPVCRIDLQFLAAVQFQRRVGHFNDERDLVAGGVSLFVPLVDPFRHDQVGLRLGINRQADGLLRADCPPVWCVTVEPTRQRGDGNGVRRMNGQFGNNPAVEEFKSVGRSEDTGLDQTVVFVQRKPARRGRRRLQRRSR